MKTSNKILLSALGVCLLLFAGLAIAVKSHLVQKGEPLIGTGSIVSDIRQLDNFTGIEIRAPFSIIISTGPQSVVIKAEENLLPYIIARTHKDHLILHTSDKRTLKPSQQVVVEISIPELDYVLNSSSGSITSDSVFTINEMLIENNGSARINIGAETKSLEISSNGSGPIEVFGNTDQLLINSNGSAKIQTSELIAREATAHTHGSGSVHLHATETLNGSINGSGSIYYSGSPKCNCGNNGSGRFVEN